MNLQEAKVYVGTYAKYNDRDTEGGWLTLSDYTNKKAFLEACRELHSDEKDPEFMYQDWEEISDALISEGEISEAIWELMEEVERRSINEDALEVWLDCTCRTIESVEEIDTVLSDFEDAYCGEWDSEEDFAEHIFNECHLHEIPEYLRYYVDYEAYSRDLFADEYVCQDGYVFRNY